MDPVDQSEMSNSYYFTQTIYHSGIATLLILYSFILYGVTGISGQSWAVRMQYRTRTCPGRWIPVVTYSQITFKENVT